MQVCLKILEDKGVLAVTKAGGENVYSLISNPESIGLRVGPLADPQSACEINLKLQKEAETFFAGISPSLPQRMPGLTAGCASFFQNETGWGYGNQFTHPW